MMIWQACHGLGNTLHKSFIYYFITEPYILVSKFCPEERLSHQHPEICCYLYVHIEIMQRRDNLCQTPDPNDGPSGTKSTLIEYDSS